MQNGSNIWELTYANVTTEDKVTRLITTHQFYFALQHIFKSHNLTTKSNNSLESTKLRNSNRSSGNTSVNNYKPERSNGKF